MFRWKLFKRKIHMTLKDVVELVKKLVQPMVVRHFRKRYISVYLSKCLEE